MNNLSKLVNQRYKLKKAAVNSQLDYCALLFEMNPNNLYVKKAIDMIRKLYSKDIIADTVRKTDNNGILFYFDLPVHDVYIEYEKDLFSAIIKFKRDDVGEEIDNVNYEENKYCTS